MFWIKRSFFSLLIILPGWLNAQQPPLTLEDAYQQARANYPLIKQKDLIKQTAEINLNNLQKGYLPQISLSGQATYQSDVTKIDVSLPGFDFNPPSKDQYKAVADVSQTIYDGGIIKQQKHAARLNQELEEQRVEVELYKLRDRINQVFFGILYLDDQLKQVDLTKQDLQIGIKQVEAQVKNGVILRSNLNVLKAEFLKADQRAIELKASRTGLLQTLALFLNHEFNDNTILIKPSAAIATSATIARPELTLYDNQIKQLEQQTKLIQARNLPKTSLFAQGGYGKPGLNLLKNDFTFYYVGGIRVNWPLAGLYTQRKEKELVKINQKIVDIQREAFLLNTNTQLSQQRSDIDRLNQLVQTDKAIIDLRTEVKDAARAQLQNGVITANDYLREVNAEDQARQTLITHELQLLQAQINYQTTLGNQ